MTISAIELREKLLYNPDTGEWTWLKSRRDGYAGKPAGWTDAYGYRRIKIDGQTYIASRLAWLYMTGAWPAEEMDHVDQDPGNDCWDNLREASRLENVQNRRLRIDNLSNAIGVYWHKVNRKWCARVDQTYLGSYDTFEEAVHARDQVAKDAHGAFVQLNTGTDK